MKFSEDFRVAICERNGVDLIITEEVSGEWTEKLQNRLPQLEIHALKYKTESLAEYAVNMSCAKNSTDMETSDLTEALSNMLHLPVVKPVLILCTRYFPILLFILVLELNSIKVDRLVLLEHSSGRICKSLIRCNILTLLFTLLGSIICYTEKVFCMGNTNCLEIQALENM